MCSVRRIDKKCKHRETLEWAEEIPVMRCSDGNVLVTTLGEPKEPLKSLLLHDSNASRRFSNGIRKCDSCFQTTALGVGKKIVTSGFSPTFTIQGEIYHRIGSSLSANRATKS